MTTGLGASGALLSFQQHRSRHDTTVLHVSSPLEKLARSRCFHWAVLESSKVELTSPLTTVAIMCRFALSFVPARSPEMSVRVSAGRDLPAHQTRHPRMQVPFVIQSFLCFSFLNVAASSKRTSGTSPLEVHVEVTWMAQ